MKNRRIHVLMTLCAFGLVLGITSLAVRDSRGQTQKTRKESTVKPTVLLPRTKPVSAVGDSSTVSAASTQNATFRTDLNWVFGGKQQRGWYLYDSLIDETLNASGGSNDFASAVSAWQKTRGMGVNGVLDQNSWTALVAQWQRDRLKDKTPATPDQLVLAPASEFYDPQRQAELRQVERQTYAAYKRMLSAAIADPTLQLAHTSADELAAQERYFKIVSAFRSRAYQEQLRRQSPNAGSAGLAVNSPHFTGRALDIYVGGHPVDTRDANRALQVNTPVYKWLVRNAARFGFRPYFYEPWHWEYVSEARP